PHRYLLPSPTRRSSDLVEPPVSAGRESVPAGESCPPPPPVGPPAPRRGSSSLSSRRLVVVGAMTAPPSTTVRIESSSTSGRVSLDRKSTRLNSSHVSIS